MKWARVMHKVLGVFLFGRPQILYGDEPVTAFPTEKVKLLFYYLALKRQSVHARSKLWGLFWGESGATFRSIQFRIR